MSQRDKDNTINKLKQFFRNVKTPSGPNRDKTDMEILRELEAVLQPQIPVAQRCKALKELCESDKINRLEDATIKRLWELTKDLIVPNRPADQRHIAFAFYQKLIQSQYEGLSIMREVFFKIIQQHNEPEDIAYRLELLKTLTDTGKNIKNFEENIGEFMLSWIPDVFMANIAQPFLEILNNIIWFNASHLDQNIVAGIIENACSKCCSMEDPTIVLQCLGILEAALCCSLFPTETLTICIVTLCRTVNKEAYCQTSWKIMKNLLGTKVGHAALLTMCNILNDPVSHKDEALLRGAVFYINMGLWGTTGSVVPMLKNSPSPVLMSFLRVLHCQRLIVTYEVILGIQRLISMSGKELSEPSWDLLCDILKAIADNISYYEKNNILPRDRIIQNAFQETITKIETMLERNEVATNPDTIYSVIEYVCENRCEKSVMQLIAYKATKIVPTQPQWLQSLYSFMNRFFTMENVEIRKNAVQVLNKIMDTNRGAYEEEILERIVIPLFSNIHHELDPNVRSCVGELLIDFVCHCETKRSLELLDIIERLLNRPFEKFAEKSQIILKNDDELTHIKSIVEKIIKSFRIKLYRLPSSHAIKIYYILIGHLEKYYQKPQLLESSVLIRLEIFVWLLNFRANSSYHLGYPDDGNSGAIRYSHYITVESNERSTSNVTQSASVQPPISSHQSSVGHQSSETGNQSQSQSSETVSSVSIRRAIRCIIECTQKERDWSIMQFVLKELPKLLQNKAVLMGAEMDALATTIINLYITRTPNEFTMGKPSISDFYAMVLPTIAGLIPYHQYFHSRTQTRIIESLQMCSRHPRVCVQALTIAMFEMPEMMLRHLPDILLEMSKMATTLNVAVPVLEFLSTLNRLPSRRFANFIVVQYMYVFAISVPYTNPHKYNQYTVSLAHHVIAGWFLKCRLPLRRNFVNYIIKGLETNFQKPFDEKSGRMDFSSLNEDSSNRKRSSSLTEHITKPRERPQLANLRAKSNEAAINNFHMELAETCIDFLARHTFSPCSALPKRLPTAEFLLAGGQSLTWMVGHNIVTITTSGCSGTPTRNGLCDRCGLLCKSPMQQQTPSLGGNNGASSSSNGTASDETLSTKASDNDNGGNNNKRYTKASLQHNSGRDSDSTDLTSSLSSSTAPTPHATNNEPTGKFFRQTSNEGQFSSSSGSLEALSRRSSNPDAAESVEVKRETSNPLVNQPSTERTRNTCACSCSGWAEFYIRRPTGNMSWIMRIQNHIISDSGSNDVPLHDLISIFMPSMGGIYNSMSPDPSFFSTPMPSNTKPVTSVLHARAFARSDDDREAGQQHRPEHMIKLPDAQPTQQEVVHGRVDGIVDTEEADDGDDDGASSDIGEQEQMQQMRQRSATETAVTLATCSSGPINIPRTMDKHKIPSGSFSDVEPEDDGDDEKDDTDLDENDTRSRNPVRRVNSSPEMSSNWRHGYSKGGLSTTGPVNPTHGSITTAQPTIDDDTAFISDDAQQQKKKNFGKDMRVSCEAIPEEIADSTPPNQTVAFARAAAIDGDQKHMLTLDVVKAHQLELQPNKLSVQNTLLPLASLPTKGLAPTTSEILLSGPHNQPPKKQHSADDAINVQAQQSQQHQKSDKIKPNIEKTKLASKPPQSPTPLSPRLLVKSTSSKLSVGGEFPRGRSKTISVMRGSEQDNRDNSKWPFRGTRAGISPSSLFLQLYHTGSNKNAVRPLQIKQTRPVELFDLIPPFETHKIGVLYVGTGQCNNETEILRNRYGSYRYMEFLQSLGTLVALKQAKEMNIFVDMETDGRDGNFTYIWQDDIIQVTFHVATLMPNKDHDPNCNEKKKNIGNDFVSIVYNESGEEYNLNTIKGQFNYACVIVQPLELNSNRIFIKCKDDVSDFICHTEPKIISDASAPLYARQLALHANMASLVAQSMKGKNQSPYASNWLERLRRIKHIRSKVLSEQNSGQNLSSDSSNGNSDKESQWNKEDFTLYTQ